MQPHSFECGLCLMHLRAASEQGLSLLETISHASCQSSTLAIAGCAVPCIVTYNDLHASSARYSFVTNVHTFVSVSTMRYTMYASKMHASRPARDFINGSESINTVA